MDRAPDFSVVVPVLDAKQFLPRSFPRVAEAVRSYASSELIVVDNGSTDGSYEWLGERLSPDLGTLVRETGVSIGEVRNRGAERAAGRAICFVDSDCLIEDDHLHKAARVLAERPEAGATGTRYQIPREAGWVSTTWHRLHKRERGGYVTYLNGGNLIVRAGAFWEAGGFDADLVTGEDAAFCRRLRRCGYRIYDDPALVAVHLGEADTLPDFYRKQRWYALGTFGTVDRSSLDKPLVMTCAHVLLLAAALALAVILPLGVIASLSLLTGAVLLVPLLSVGYRWLQLGRIRSPIKSIILYELFFAARIAGLLLIGTGRTEGWRPSRRSGSYEERPGRGAG